MPDWLMGDWLRELKPEKLLLHAMVSGEELQEYKHLGFVGRWEGWKWKRIKGEYKEAGATDVIEVYRGHALGYLMQQPVNPTEQVWKFAVESEEDRRARDTEDKKYLVFDMLHRAKEFRDNDEPILAHPQGHAWFDERHFLYKEWRPDAAKSVKRRKIDTARNEVDK